MSTHEIPEDVTNSAVLLCIAEYVRSERDREILRDHWFRDVSLLGLTEKYDISLHKVKCVVYGLGDKVLLRAAKLKKDLEQT